MPLIAFVTVDSPGVPPTAAALRAAWITLWPDQPPLPPVEPGDGSMVFALQHQLCAVSWMPGPVPWGDLQGPAACAWHWPDAAARLETHAAHLLVAVMDADPSVQTAKRLTRLVSAAIEATPHATGVFWGAGAAVSPADRFLLDGHTIGASEDERITVRHGPSAWDRPGPVLHLDL